MSSPALRRARSLRTITLVAALIAPALLQACAAPFARTNDYYFMGQSDSPALIVPGVAVSGIG